MRINHNIAALNTHRQLGQANNAQQNSMEKLSSGLRINKAGDDAAGLAISEKMRGQIRGLDQAQRNAQDGISMIQTAEGAMNESHSILQRMRELSVQSANDTNTSTDRGELQKEVDQLSQELSRIGDNTEFNTQNLLDGSFEGTFQIGANEGQNLSVEINDMRGSNLGVADGFEVAQADGNMLSVTAADNTLEAGEYTAKDSVDVEVAGAEYTGEAAIVDDAGNAAAVDIGGDGAYFLVSDLQDDGAGALEAKTGATAAFTAADSATLTEDTTFEVKGIDISSQSAADSAITKINDAIETVSTERSKLGAVQNRLDHTINNLGTSSENLTAAESRIRDVDYAFAA